MTENYSVEVNQPESTNPQLYDREMEEAVIGAVMINPDVYIDLAPLIRPEDFYINRHQWIWQALTDLFQENQSFDILTVRQKLDSQGHLEDVGGVEYLISLSNVVPSSLHAVSYARNLSALSARRRLLNAANDIALLPIAWTTTLKPFWVSQKKPSSASVRTDTPAISFPSKK
jgi:replicative DNA helicase